MPLSGLQIAQLAEVLYEHFNQPALGLFAKDLGIDITKIAPYSEFKEVAVRFIQEMNSAQPPRDGELLEALRKKGNSAVRNFADQLLAPPFFSPTADAHDAVVLGKAAFVDRAELRRELREFTKPNANSTRVIIIRGEQPGGKSYSWEFLRHLARTCVGVTPYRLSLAGAEYNPSTLLEAIFHLLDMNPANLTPMISNQPPCRINALINVFKGQLCKLSRPYWLVIDDLNDESVTPPVRETAYAIAHAVEDSRSENLWIALLGYNSTITDPELRLCARDNAQFPSASLLADYFQLMAEAGPELLTRPMAQQYADTLLAKFPDLTKEDMMRLTPLILKTGQMLRQGLRA